MSVPTRFACEVPLQTTGFCFGASNYAGHNLTVCDRCAGQSYALTRDNARARQVDVRRGRTDRQAGNDDVTDAILDFGLRRGAGIARARIDQWSIRERQDAARDGAARC